MIEGIMLYGYLATMPFYVNAEASCCDLCNQTSGLCQSYTYFPNNRTCLLFKANIVGFRNCSNEEPCFSGRIRKFLNFEQLQPTRLERFEPSFTAAERTTPIRPTTTPIVTTRRSSYRPPPFSYNQLSNITVNKGKPAGKGVFCRAIDFEYIFRFPYSRSNVLLRVGRLVLLVDTD